MRRLLAAILIATFPVAVAPAVGAAVPGPIAAPVRFVPKDGTTLLYGGRGGYGGSLEVRRVGDGLTVINTLSLDGYVAGIREVPPSWPMEALKAQAVAARTYALWELESGHWQKFGYDVCATTDCQVYDGLATTEARNGRRWAEAVRATAGQVLLYEGRPALTRYHSSDGGRTLDNATVFPSDGARPYLRSIDDPFDKVSPLHAWTAIFTTAQMQQILHDAISLRGDITDIHAERDRKDVTITTRNGRVDMTAVRFRNLVSEFAPKEYPDTFPQARSDGLRMPETLPSSRFDISKTPVGFRVDGIGYGHGVGMSQWGAKGRADAGQSYRQILGAYYHGLTPTRWNGRNTIRVAIATDHGSVAIGGDGPFSVTTPHATISSGTVGEWTITTVGSRSMSVDPPAGYALPLVLTGVSVPSSVLIDPPRSSNVDVGFVLPKSAIVTATLSRDGRDIASSRSVFDAGERTISITPPRKDVVGGRTYTVRLSADDGASSADATREIVLVTRGGFGWLKLLAVLLLAGAAIVVRRRVVLTRRASRRRSPFADTNRPARTGTASGPR
jgi:stage II sporulation protein D